MVRFEAIYRDYSACSNDFSRGIEFLKQRDLYHAVDCFYTACQCADSANPHYDMYLCYYGYARILNGDYRAIEHCRRAAGRRREDANLYYILARAEMFCRNRQQMIMAIAAGIKLDNQHLGLRLMRKTIAHRRFKPIPFLPRNNILNRSIGRMLRRRK